MFGAARRDFVGHRQSPMPLLAFGVLGAHRWCVALAIVGGVTDIE